MTISQSARRTIEEGARQQLDRAAMPARDVLPAPRDDGSLWGRMTLMDGCLLGEGVQSVSNNADPSRQYRYVQDSERWWAQMETDGKTGR